LNDDFEGGEFVFFNKELKYKLEKGDAIMFPSNFMYPHEVMPVTQGTRYSIITWFI
jgi:predicted 2-oxoglutarate/Fe(II)-dependent dioxygenase YbiX